MDPRKCLPLTTPIGHMTASRRMRRACSLRSLAPLNTQARYRFLNTSILLYNGNPIFLWGANIAKFCCIQFKMQKKKKNVKKLVFKTVFGFVPKAINSKSAKNNGTYTCVYFRIKLQKYAPTEKISYTMPFSTVICDAFQHCDL